MTDKYNFSNKNTAIVTDRLLLRPFEDSDADFVYRQFSDPDMCRFFNEPPFESLEAAKEIIDFYIKQPDNDKLLRWVMIKKIDNEIIGTCGYHNYNKRHKKVEIGYDVWKEYWRQGYISEALPVLLTYCFDYLGVNKVYAKLDPENIASRKTVEKLGFTAEGILREDEKLGDRYLDMLYMSILKKEWEKQT